MNARGLLFATGPLRTKLSCLVLCCLVSSCITSVMSTRKAVAYVRVSTEKQAAEGVSLEAQRARVAAWAVAAGLDLAAVHVDAGLSGSRADNRPALALALAEVAKCRGVLVVYSLSRLARSTRDTLAIAERLERAGADLVSLSESIDTSSAAGRMVFRMLAVLAEFERDLISERTTSAMACKSAKGERVSGIIPFGFRLGADGVRLEEEPTEQGIIARLVELRRSGLSFRAIASELESLGMRPRSGGAWSPSVIRSIVGRAGAA